MLLYQGLIPYQMMRYLGPFEELKEFHVMIDVIVKRFLEIVMEKIIRDKSLLDA